MVVEIILTVVVFVWVAVFVKVLGGFVTQTVLVVFVLALSVWAPILTVTLEVTVAVETTLRVDVETTLTVDVETTLVVDVETTLRVDVETTLTVVVIFTVLVGTYVPLAVRKGVSEIR